MPLRMSVRPTANHSHTPLGTGITAAPVPRRQRTPKPATPKPGSGHGRSRQIRSRSPVWRRCGDATASRRHKHLSKAIRRHSQIPAPTVGQARRHVGLTRHVAHHCTWFERRRYNRLLLLDAPPVTPLRTGRHLDAWHRTVSCTSAKHRCLHWCLPVRSTQRSQDGPRRRVTVDPAISLPAGIASPSPAASD
jgi:hypothetical protein